MVLVVQLWLWWFAMLMFFVVDLVVLVGRVDILWVLLIDVEVVLAKALALMLVHYLTRSYLLILLFLLV